MKKTLLILCALLLTAIGASAQITDVTSEYIKNASFEEDDVSNLTVDGTRASGEEGAQTGAWTVSELTGWTLTLDGTVNVCDLMSAAASATDNNFGVPGDPSDGTYMLYLRNAWTDNKEVTLRQSVTLPEGKYMVTVDSKCVSSTSSTGTLVAGDASTALTIHTTENGTEETKNNPYLASWDTAELTFTLTEETEVSLGVNIIFNGGEGSFLLDNFKLYSIGDFDYNVSTVLANPSFEEDDPATEGWDVDYDNSDGSTPRASTDKTGAWTIPIADGKPTGWTITEIAEVCDLMTKDAAATDNGLGGPGDAADGTYMLYMKKTWGDTDNATVVQTITLPAGDYMFTVDSKFFSGGATAKMVAGEVSADIHINAATATTNILPDTEWTTNTLMFTLDETTELTIGVQMAFPNTSPGSILLDNFQLFSTQDVVVWEMTDANWGTMIIPFDAAVPEGLTLYAGDELKLEEDGSTLTVSDDNAAETIAANTPYLVKGTEGTYTFTGTPENEEDSYTSGMLVGTLVDMTQDDFPTSGGTVYVLQNHEDDGEGLAFYPITSSSTGVTLDAYHCYLTTTSNFLALHLPGMETGIVAVEGAEVEANGAIYDLSGRRVAKAVKGVYIQNGKKVLVK